MQRRGEIMMYNIFLLKQLHFVSKLFVCVKLITLSYQNYDIKR